MQRLKPLRIEEIGHTFVSWCCKRSVTLLEIFGVQFPDATISEMSQN